MSTTSDPNALSLLLLSILPSTLLSLFLYLPTQYIPIPTRYIPNPSSRTRQHFQDALRLYTTAFGIPIAVCMAAILGWIGWLIAIVVAAVSEGAFGVLIFKWVSREGSREQRMKCRGCGKKSKDESFCAGCGVEEPLREFKEREREREREMEMEMGDEERMVKE